MSLAGIRLAVALCEKGNLTKTREMIVNQILKEGPDFSSTTPIHPDRRHLRPRSSKFFSFKYCFPLHHLQESIHTESPWFDDHTGKYRWRMSIHRIQRGTAFLNVEMTGGSQKEKIQNGMLGIHIFEIDTCERKIIGLLQEGQFGMKLLNLSKRTADSIVSGDTVYFSHDSAAHVPTKKNTRNRVKPRLRDWFPLNCFLVSWFQENTEPRPTSISRDDTEGKSIASKRAKYVSKLRLVETVV